MSRLVHLAEPARVFWCEQTPGGVSLQFDVTSTRVDPSTATAARIEFSIDEGATYTTWTATLLPHVPGSSVYVVHVFDTGDLDADMAALGGLVLNPIVTIAGQDYPCDPRFLRVIP